MHTDAEYEALWGEFTTAHGKTYSPTELINRFRIFKDNVDFIADHNKNHADAAGYTVGINQFADMTRAEWSRQYLGLNARISRDSSNEKTLSVEDAPASVDWVAKGAVTPVKNQAQCGSCWAFSTTGSVEGRLQIATGKLTSLSEEELVQCAASYGNQGCNGGLMDDGFKYIKARGDASEASYPYTSGAGQTGTCSQSKVSTDGIAAGSLTGYTDVPSGSEDQLKAAVAAGPVSVAIEADQSGFQFYKTGVFSGACGTKLDHGVLVVGYGTSSGSDYWQVKNSWGTTWGMQGYIQLARNTGSHGGQCGVAMQASYPIISSHGPAPGPPAPPSPPTPPSPPSPPAGSFYEAPPCQSSEQAVRVQGVSGSFCSPTCSNGSCPAAPAGSTAQGQCILSTGGSSQPTNCALVCGGASSRKLLGGGGSGGCPTGATCQHIQGTGICTYPAAEVAALLKGQPAPETQEAEIAPVLPLN
jgi:C1A family cysteine protease